MALVRDLGFVVPRESILGDGFAAYLADETESRGVRGRADAVVLPANTDEVARLLSWCYEHEIPITLRGGGTGFAGGAVPLDGGVILGLERMVRVRSFEPLLWRMSVEAGMRTADLRRIARENGLVFPPDPGRRGAVADWRQHRDERRRAARVQVLDHGGLGNWHRGRGAARRSGDDWRADPEGRGWLRPQEPVNRLGRTLGIITAAWLRFLPALEAALPVVAFYSGTGDGCAAIERVLGTGLLVAALEYLDGPTLEAAGGSFITELPAGAAFLIVAEADGTQEEAERMRANLIEVLAEGALAVQAPTEPAVIADLWRWRDGVSIAVTARRGGKVSEDIVVPLDRLAEAIEETLAIGHRHGLPACSWGHAGDGNLHSTFLVEPDNAEELTRAERAAVDLFALAAGLGGSISGEHGVGLVKRGQLARQWSPRALALHAGIKNIVDPKGLLNPGKKA